MSLQFKKAVREQKKGRIALVGPSGSGKTMTALKIAQGMGSKIALIDTEHGSATLYADEADFSHLNLTDYSVEAYSAALELAGQEGFDVVIIDSLSHAWEGEGGILERNDKLGKTKYRGNGFQAWGETTPLLRRFITQMLTCPHHLIVTMRVKTEYVVEKDERTGKSVPKKIGTAPVMRAGAEYEFDVVGDLDHDHNFFASKTRVKTLDGRIITKAGKELGKEIADWLNSGAAAPKEAPKLEVVTPPARKSRDLPESSRNPLAHVITTEGSQFKGQMLADVGLEWVRKVAASQKTLDKLSPEDASNILDIAAMSEGDIQDALSEIFESTQS